ncbi:hypothetical protein [Sideroxydans sp.]
MFDDIYYHGSKHTSLSKLDMSFASTKLPFGPAVYLTKDKVVAGYYTGNDGVIYCVRISGDVECTINLDERVESQSAKAIEAIQKLSKIRYKTIDILGKNVRNVIHPEYECRMLANSFLRNRGIWMLYGHLDVYEDSGLMDRGPQFAVINDNHLSIAGLILRNEMFDEVGSFDRNSMSI